MPAGNRTSLDGLEMVLNTIHNWFVMRREKCVGRFTVSSGALDIPFVKNGQYYRIRGSMFNDGLHQKGVEFGTLTDETFIGEIAPLAIPRAVIALAEEIEAWREKNPETDKTSESFGGYSYTRGGAGQNGSSSSGWKAAFANRLADWRKPYEFD